MEINEDGRLYVETTITDGKLKSQGGPQPAAVYIDIISGEIIKRYQTGNPPIIKGIYQNGRISFQKSPNTETYDAFPDTIGLSAQAFAKLRKIYPNRI